MERYCHVTDNLAMLAADAVLMPLLTGTARLAAAAARAVRRALDDRAESRIASILGIPKPADIRAAWVPPRRTLRQALVIGSRLADLSPAHSPACKWSAPDASGRRHLAGRDGGLKGYFAKHLHDLPYSTAMRYRCLALRVRRHLDLPAQVPLESALASKVPGEIAANPALLDALVAARRRLAGLLADIRSQRELARYLDRQPGSDRLPVEAALRDELLRRGEERIAAAIAAGRPLNRHEKRARRLLARLRRLALLFGAH